MPTMPFPPAPIVPSPAGVPPPTGDSPPPSSSLPFLLLWFVVPVVVILLVDALRLAERITAWLGLD